MVDGAVNWIIWAARITNHESHTNHRLCRHLTPAQPSTALPRQLESPLLCIPIQLCNGTHWIQFPSLRIYLFWGPLSHSPTLAFSHCHCRISHLRCQVKRGLALFLLLLPAQLSLLLHFPALVHQSIHQSVQSPRSTQPKSSRQSNRLEAPEYLPASANTQPLLCTCHVFQTRPTLCSAVHDPAHRAHRRSFPSFLPPVLRHRNVAMFWRFGGYANISTIDTILDKPDFTLEELLDESDLIQELKQHNSKLIEYLREDSILEKLLEYVVAPRLEVFATPDDPADDESKGKSRLLPFSRPRASSRATDVTDNDEEEQEKRRNRYALVASEVLSSDTWSIYEALTENRDLIRKFWKFLERPAPLDPLQASYFTKVNESLFEKKTDDMMELLRSIPNVVAELLRHVECPMIMDLLLKIIALDRNEGGQGIVEWLFSKDIIPALLSCLDPKHSWVVQTAAGDFIKAIITISANASQNEQQCIGPNELTRQLVSEPCVEQLIGYMLGGGNPLTVGVGIVIEVIRKNNSDYDPDMGTESNQVPSSRDPIYLGYLLRLFARNVPKFMSLIMDGPAKKEGSESTFGEKLEPLGFDRFKTCELMAELLHCSNMGLLNEVGAQELIATRDAVRQRLRDEGRLGPLREDDQSADDLTMRMSHGAVHEEGRRLEVTNADDDGFEEVESSKEMSEDTSHEFVKAEDDITAAPPSSFIDKDEDDFVDEPLSSPRLSVGSDKINEQRFEDPDLVVAPLSPSKSKPAELAESAKFANPDSIQRTELDLATREIDEHLTSTQQPTESSLSASPLPEPTPSGASLNPSNLGDQHRGLSPHPEDTPAPLFTSSSAPQSVAPDQTAQKTETVVHPPADSHPAHGVQSSEQIAVVDDPSTALGQQQPPQHINIPLEHVVGDFLKMQFVEHRVVPAILTFFFSYPWNNFLHNVVYDIVQQVFNGPMDRGYNPTLAVSLFEAADITAAIINGQQASDESQAKTKTRMGYMGHLTLIAEEVV
ncbi:sporulation-induced protein [Metarhizium acridum]|nr:sporulation-induced protein [Metarhizium acridum]